jgi:hypothetical protein
MNGRAYPVHARYTRGEKVLTLTNKAVGARGPGLLVAGPP